MKIEDYKGKIVICNAPNHEGEYVVFDHDKQRNGLKIQRPDEFKAHWVNVKTVTIVGDFYK